VSRPRLLYAHRGASADLPENTLEAFALGLEQGANALELDVRLSRDGRVVVSHDADLSRLAGRPLRIDGATLDELRTIDVGRGLRLATLDEVLERFAVPLNVDLKDRSPALVERTLELVRSRGAASRVRLASFHEANLSLARRLGYEGPTGLGPREARRLVLLPGLVSRLFPPRGDALQVPPKTGPLRLDTPRIVARAHALGLRVDYWVINDVAQARQLLALGADGLVSDRPALLAPLFRG
jgi:glycerophosphoryl diester phosphodiesterase